MFRKKKKLKYYPVLKIQLYRYRQLQILLQYMEKNCDDLGFNILYIKDVVRLLLKGGGDLKDVKL